MIFRIDRNELLPYEKQEEVEINTIPQLIAFLKENGMQGNINLYEDESPQIEDMCDEV